MASGAEQLRDWMQRRGFNQAETARAFGWTVSFVSMLMNEHRLPSLDNAVKIERVTGIPVAAWSSREDDELAPTGSDGRSKPPRHR